MKYPFEKLNYEYLYFANFTGQIFTYDIFSEEVMNLQLYEEQKDISGRHPDRVTRMGFYLDVSNTNYTGF